jgi:hypothetical protein
MHFVKQTLDRGCRMRATAAWISLLLGALGCSSTVQPRAGVTLLITNATCETGQCAPVQILGFPSNQPHTPGGFWSLDLGIVSAPSACLTLPPTATFRVIDASTGATTTYMWTTAERLSLGALQPPASRIQATPSTSAFVPASAPGWSVTLPASSPVSPRQPCSS